MNGLRACLAGGFTEWMRKTRPAVLGIQEVRAFPEQVEPIIEKPLKAWKRFWCPAERPGYSGVAIFTREEPREVVTGLGIPEFDREGRLLVADFGPWAFFNAYFPKGSGRERDNSRVPYKLAFYEAVLERARERMARGQDVVIGGDFNTAHREIDLRNWKTNRKTSGFLPEEREWIDRYLAAGLRDVFRERHADEDGHYTWWSQRQNARARNIGWRIDYLLASATFAGRVRRAWIEPHVRGSDHAPVAIELRS